MRLPNVHGIIRRRVLVNFRINADVAQAQIPPPFRPKLHAGYAVGGICLIRLENIRPKRFPQVLGFSSENAAHRFAVTWSDSAGEHEGVYIPRRDSASLINHLAGGRLFPGEHHLARFGVLDTGDQVSIDVRSADRSMSVHVAAVAVGQLPAGSIFQSLDEASAFFESGSVGYSARRADRKLDGIVLQTHRWEVQPLRVVSVASSYFSDESLFPHGTVSFDCALIMRDVSHAWHSAAETHV